MKRFKVVAEKSHGIRNAQGHQINPFRIRDIFDPNLKMDVERRTWDALEAPSERAVRRFFAKACAENYDGLRGFTIASIEEVLARQLAPTTCGYCSYEEADGELIEQCAKCKEADRAKGVKRGNAK